jgi:HD-GYP domain-containing protein (c-di-GMP phosphodiesterase class II)
MSDLNPHMDAGAERVLEESLERRHRGLDRRELAGNLVLTCAFLAVAVATTVLVSGDRAVSPWLALLFVGAYAVVGAVELWGDFGNVVPTQIVFVPMLLLLPAQDVPLLVAAAIVLTSAGQAIRGGAALGRSALAVGDAWFSVGPALVLVALGSGHPTIADWWVYALALAAQLLGDGLVTLGRAHFIYGMRPREVLRDLRMVYRVDVLLFPVGLLAALAAADAPATSLLVLPLAYLLLFFSREREASMRKSLELGRAYRGTALLLRDLLEEDDEYTGRHTEDVVGLSVSVAERMGLDEDTRRSAELGALLHDIGKIAVPDEIINKPGPLDDEEWAIMKTHTVEGERMLAQVGGLLADVGLVVRASHERWDGGGYPDGLAGDDIPLAACIVSACDAFNAMTTDRSYRKALPLSVAVAELRKHSGTQFCPAVVDALVGLVLEAEAEQVPVPGWELIAAPEAAPAAPAPLPAPLPAPRQA